MLVQALDPKTNRWMKIDTSTGGIVVYKKTAGPYKNTPIMGQAELSEINFCKHHITPWLKEQGIFYRRIHGWHDYLVCTKGKLIVLEAKRSAKADRQATQWRDKKALEAAGGLWFWVYPENWEEVKNELRRLDL